MLLCQKVEAILPEPGQSDQLGSESRQLAPSTGERYKLARMVCSFCTLSRALPTKPKKPTQFIQ